jgi:hypothetical protein
MSQATHTIEIPEDIFRGLLRLSELRGITPADWIASRIPSVFLQREERPLDEVLNGIIGAVDSSVEPRPHGPFSLVSDLIAEKFRKQGLIIP